VRRRVRIAVALAAIVTLCGGCVVEGTGGDPACSGEDTLFYLAAQAVPSATLLPCVAQLAAGWNVSGTHTINGGFRFWLASDRAGPRAVQVTLQESCDVSGAVEVQPSVDEVGTRRFEEPISISPAFAANRYYTFPGGCVEVAYRFAEDAGPTLVLEADQAIEFLPRKRLVDRLAEDRLILCGAEAPACPGGD
jgi:hypothetical protein